MGKIVFIFASTLLLHGNEYTKSQLKFTDRYHSCNYHISVLLLWNFSGRLCKCGANFSCVHLVVPPIFSHNHACMRRTEQENIFLKKALWLFTESNICSESFDGSTSWFFFFFLKAIKRTLWTSKSQKGHVEMHMIYCLAWEIIFVRFHCMARGRKTCSEFIWTALSYQSNCALFSLQNKSWLL